MQVNWKDRYYEVFELMKTFYSYKEKIDFLFHKIEAHVEASKRLDLEERKKVKFCRLKEDINVDVEYHADNSKKQMFFKKGTLIDTDIRGNFAWVYLDDDGDGNIYFPKDKLEEVELDVNSYDYGSVLWQG